MSRLNTLRVRFALGIAGLLLAILIVFGTYVYLNMASSLGAALDDSLQLSGIQAIAAADIDHDQLAISDGIPATTALTELRARGLTIRFLRLNGTILQATGAYRRVPVLVNSTTAATQGHATFTTIRVPSEQTSLRIYTAPIIKGEKVMGIVQIA